MANFGARCLVNLMVLPLRGITCFFALINHTLVCSTLIRWPIKMNSDHHISQPPLRSIYQLHTHVKRLILKLEYLLFRNATSKYTEHILQKCMNITKIIWSPKMKMLLCWKSGNRNFFLLTSSLTDYFFSVIFVISFHTPYAYWMFINFYFQTYFD